MSDAGRIIDELGGTARVADGLGIEFASTVSNWRERGIPPARWPALMELARAQRAKSITWERLARTQPAEARA